MWPQPAGAHLGDEVRASTRSTRRTVSGTPISLLNEPLGRDRRARRSRSWASMSLVLVLPCDPVMPTTRQPRAAARHDVPARAGRAPPARRRRRRPARRPAARREHRGRAAPRRRPRRSRDRRPARPRSRRTARPRTDVRASRRRPPPTTTTSASAGVRPSPPTTAAISRQRHRDHRRRRPVRASAEDLAARPPGRRTGSTASADLLPCLVTLAGDQHGVPGRGPRASARSIAARRSPTSHDLAPRRPRLAPRPAIAARIAAGSSLRGLSSVTTSTSASRGRDLAHQRALALVAVAAGAEHDDQPSRASPGAARRAPP